MGDLALVKVVWSTVLHAVGSPTEAIIRVSVEGGLVYGLCRSWKFVKALRWTFKPIVEQSYIRRVFIAYGRTAVLRNLFLLLPLDFLRAVCVSIPRGFYLDEAFWVPETNDADCKCSFCGTKLPDR